MDRWAWEQLNPWLEIRHQLPIGAVLCVIHGPTTGRRWEPSAARNQLHHAASAAGVRRRFAPHQLRHAHAVEMAHEGVPLVVIQRQLGQHTNLGITSVYLQGIDSSEIISTVHGRPSPTISATAGLQMTRYFKVRPGWPGPRRADPPPHARLARSGAALSSARLGLASVAAGASRRRRGRGGRRAAPGAPRRHQQKLQMTAVELMLLPAAERACGSRRALQSPGWSFDARTPTS